MKDRLMNQWARDLGDPQFKAEDGEKIPQEPYVEYVFCTLRMVPEVYEGMNDAVLLQKVKTKIDTMAYLWIKVKNNITNFIKECKDFNAYHSCWPQNLRLATAQPKGKNMWQSTAVTPLPLLDTTYQERQNHRVVNKAQSAHPTVIADQLRDIADSL